MESLELIVDEGRPANAGRFFQLGTDLIALLDELSEVPVAWRVDDLRIGSAIARVAPPDSGPKEARLPRLVVSSLDAVRAGAGLPGGWSPDAVKVAHRFVEHGQPADDTEDWVPPLLVLVGRDQPDLSVRLTAELGGRLADLQPFERRMPGAVRGTLVGLNVSRGNRASIRTSSGRIVRVGFESSLRGDLKEAMLQSVELRGEVRQDDNGGVFHVRAESVDVLTKPDVRWADIFGSDPNFTGGVPIDEWLEVNRGEA